MTEKSMERFVDLGAGWFLYEDNRLTVICDATSSDPDQSFGPAAWAGQPGPVSGRALLEAHPVRQGEWQQTGPEDWKWFSDVGEEFDEAPASWPRRVVLIDSPASPVLASLANWVVDTEAALVELLQEIAKSLPVRALPLVSANGRLASAHFNHPHIFGEIEAPTTTH